LLRVTQAKNVDSTENIGEIDGRVDVKRHGWEKNVWIHGVYNHHHHTKAHGENGQTYRLDETKNLRLIMTVPPPVKIGVEHRL
jgi:hypothetical protein